MDRERELKYDLGDEQATRRLEAALGRAGGARWQESRFFDSADGALGRRLWALRLRGEWLLPPDAAGDAGETPGGPPDRMILSLKGAREGAGAFHDRAELQMELPPAAWSSPGASLAALPPEWRALLAADGVSGAGEAEKAGGEGAGLAEFARFANLRRAFPLPPCWTAEVDRTLFGDGRRAWEVEVEIGPDDDPVRMRARVEDLLARAGIPARPQERSKLERARRAGDLDFPGRLRHD